MKLFSPKILLHLEGLAVLVTSVMLYGRWGHGWTWFAATLLLPDLFLLGYLVNPRFGAVGYNAVHTYAAPLVMLVGLLATDRLHLLWIVLVWMAHIGMDRLVGYGLKYGGEGKETHLSRV